ncbi:thioredoxin-like protein AAED1 isoform X3 [Microtus ochrogaster]|uniref:Thioredoxin-like protein AAED1 isoform X3 n=1 Tax=Microtus ochrogaster TaxID=79684 RepID=A0ABM1TWF3_MICOH|nr:thioredoxin-like protein AAED1 isoform X3 [Microtus ochrogaster]
MAAPVTRQVSGCAGPVLTPTGSDTERGQPLAAAVADLPVLDASGRRVSFGALFRERRAVVVFVRHFLCYVCKEYVEDLAKIPKSFLRPFCKLTGYSHEIYVDPEREIYKRLGMKRGEEISSSGQSPHIKSNLLSGSLQSLWRAVTGPLFDFQGDPAQQGGTFILGPDWELNRCGQQELACRWRIWDHRFKGSFQTSRLFRCDGGARPFKMAAVVKFRKGPTNF